LTDWNLQILPDNPICDKQLSGHFINTSLKRGVNDIFPLNNQYEQTETFAVTGTACRARFGDAGVLGFSAGPAAEDRLSVGHVTAQLAPVRSCHRS
ncbi:MAG TPA: hypothetical protein VGW32_07050, partial [Pyrinomonadaceae bacterium]|nr:hypothetical protein [Pyrinomonadaceae bacterium]